MMRRLLVALLVLGLTHVGVSEAGSAQRNACGAGGIAAQCYPPFALDSSDASVIYLDGDLSDDAPANFLRVLRAAPEAKTLVLSSDGGGVDPALLIAREVRKRGLATTVPVGAECLSSCALIFLSGVERRLGGKLGVHQISDTAGDAVSVQQAFADVFLLMREVGASDGVISLMLTTPPDRIHYLTKDEVAAFNVATVAEEDVAAPPLPEAQPADGSALLLEASDDGRTGAVPFSGTVTWSRGQDDLGLPTIVGKAFLPARNLNVTLLFRKNTDASLPASHLFEVNFGVSESFVGGSVAGLPGILLKDAELIQGQPLVGASERVVGNSFLFALSAAPEDLDANILLLTDRRWMDLALIYSTGKRAIVTLERDGAAMGLFQSVMKEWAREGYALEGVTVKPMTHRGADQPAQFETFVRIEQESDLGEALVRHGFGLLSKELMIAAIGRDIEDQRLSAGSWLRVVFGPSRDPDRPIPYRLSIYVPTGDGGRQHLVTAALTDAGQYVRAVAPQETAFPVEHVLPRPRPFPNEKADRRRPTIGPERLSR